MEVLPYFDFVFLFIFKELYSPGKHNPIFSLQKFEAEKPKMQFFCQNEYNNKKFPMIKCFAIIFILSYFSS